MRDIEINAMKTLTWDDVVAEHGSVAAIVKKEGKISSVLCGGKDYPDSIDNEEIIYYVPDRKHYLPYIKLFKECKSDEDYFKVYRKLQQNKWLALGYFCVEKIELECNSWKIYLKGKK